MSLTILFNTFKIFLTREVKSNLTAKESLRKLDKWWFVGP